MKSVRGAVFILATLVLMLAAITTASAQIYTDIFNFDGIHGEYGTVPDILAQGRDGNLYGTTWEGGNSTNCYDGCGVVFKITPSGTQTVLYNFGNDINGGMPSSGLTLGTDGNFYGTTYYGGANGYGTIFKITPRGSLTTLYSFCSQAYCTDGAFPLAPPIQGVDGNFYGTTGGGTAYKITSSGTFTLMGYRFGQSGAPLLQGTTGNFYGTFASGWGAVFKMTPGGVGAVVYAFQEDGTYGLYPWGAVIQIGDGDLYGTALGGGDQGEYCGAWGGCGTAFRLTPQGAITVLHYFGDPSYPNDGYNPWAGLVQATDGNLYGVTSGGGTGGEYAGVIFQIDQAGAYSVLYNFGECYPESTPMQHTNGEIYGLTFDGGSSNYGVVYSFDMGLGPFVRLVPPAGKVGQTGGILGQGFTGTTGVSLNGVPANFTVVSDTYIRATVPAGATTGFVTVTTPSGTLTSNVPFHVLP